MIFCVLLDPDSIRASAAAGEWGEDHLIGVLQCLLQNCLIAETESWRFSPELALAIRGIQNQDARLKAGALLESLEKRSRFVGIVDDSAFDLDAPLSEIARAQVRHPNLDVIVTQGGAPEAATVEVTKIQHFHQSNFAQNRQRMACGVNLEPDKLSAPDFFNSHFSKLHLTETDFHIIDYAIGDKGFGSNFHDNLPFWINFLKLRGSATKFVIHTIQPKQPGTLTSIKNRLERLVMGTKITTEVIAHADLPHERFLVTTQFCFDIGRGIDLFDPHTAKNRDIKLGLSQRSFSYCVLA
jgi:hypothetical protein